MSVDTYYISLEKKQIKYINKTVNGYNIIIIAVVHGQWKVDTYSLQIIVNVFKYPSHSVRVRQMKSTHRHNKLRFKDI